ncbi:MAG: DedA family protein [bacterium]|nr:DedA family protein [bacterium]
MEQWLFDLHNPILVYLVLFSLLLLGAVGFPMPEDIPLIVGGVLSQSGTIDPWTTFAVCYTGVLLGDIIIFAIGRKLGPSLFEKPWFKNRMGPHRVKHLRLKLEKRSLWMIFIARHLFYLRTATFLVCGAVKMRWSRFILADAMAALISVPLMIWLGYTFSEQYNSLVKWMDEAKLWLILLAFPAAVVIYLLFFKRKKLSNPTESELSDLED